MAEKEQRLQRDDNEGNRMGGLPLLDHKDYGAPSVFTPENLLREARRQKGYHLFRAHHQPDGTDRGRF